MTELTCRELVELVTEYLEGTLSPDERRRFDGHLADCPACTSYLAQFERVIQLTGTLVPQDISADAREALLAEFRAWKSQS